MKRILQTDWDKYYHSKKSIFSIYTQKHTLYMLLEIIKNTFKDKKISVCELGGGNSCFAVHVNKNCSIAKYDIIDNNLYSIELFMKKNIDVQHKGLQFDLTQKVYLDEYYDFVFSVGVIEHFKEDLRAKVIENHFSCCVNGGFVLLSYPTPTIKYRFFRKCMEILGVWQFVDEIPLRLDDLKSEIEKYGIIYYTVLNRKLFLTQQIVLCKKLGRN